MTNWLKACTATVGLIALTGCTLQQTGTDRYTLSAPSLNQILGQVPNQTAQAPASTTTKYAGPIDGGTANVTLTKLNATQYHLDLGASGNNGVGGVSGVLTQVSGSDLYEMTTDDQGNKCGLSVKFLPQAIQVDEVFANGMTGCMVDHGASLSFDGQLSQVQ